MTFDKDLTTPILPTEEWRQIEEFPSYYISNLGRVKTVDRVVIRGNGLPQTIKGRILKQNLHKKSGYLRIELSNDKVKGKSLYVHCLVMEAFNGKKPEGMTVEHKNTIRTDNRLQNLTYCSMQDNCHNPITIQRYTDANQDKNKKPILQYSINGHFVKKWKSAKDAAKELNIDSKSIYNCISGRYIQSNGHIWRMYQPGSPIPLTTSIEDRPIYRPEKCIKPISQYDLQGKFIRNWSSASEAAKELKICRVSISNCITGKQVQGGGYIWKYQQQ